MSLHQCKPALSSTSHMYGSVTVSLSHSLKLSLLTHHITFHMYSNLANAKPFESELDVLVFLGLNYCP